MIVSSTFPWLMGTSRSLKANGLLDAGQGGIEVLSL